MSLQKVTFSARFFNWRVVQTTCWMIGLLIWIIFFQQLVAQNSSPFAHLPDLPRWSWLPGPGFPGNHVGSVDDLLWSGTQRHGLDPSRGCPWDDGTKGTWDLFSFFGEETTTPIATKREFGRHPPKMKPNNGKIIRFYFYRIWATGCWNLPLP